MFGFLRNTNGSVAVSFAISVVPLLGAAGIALDYLRVSWAETFLQTQADAAALGSAASYDQSTSKNWIAQFKANADRESGQGTQLTNVDIEGQWISQSDYRVDANADVPLTLLSLVPGMSDRFSVSIVSVARVSKPKVTSKPPKVTDLDPEAADYNRIYTYCFAADEKSDPDTQGRSQETALADNAGTTYDSPMPSCEGDETLSYHLYNVRNARTTPKLWDGGNATRYHYYTDTVIAGGTESYDLGGYSILETILCDSFADCVGETKGGVIPEGKNRTPQHASDACEPGKFLYYGWEDRPPGLGWTDLDYNDIRVVIECATSEASGQLLVKLIK